jgi:protocatechuate 3,4-dioxygenase, alpha subunit
MSTDSVNRAMTDTTELPATPGQTVGPFFGYALPFDGGGELVPPGRADAIRLSGLVIDGAGNPVPDSILEIWQTDPDGKVVQQEGSLRRNGWTFTGWGRASTSDLGEYSFTTLRPGSPGEGKAAFIALVVFARGLTNRLFTRIYLPGDDAALDADPLLSALPAERRSTLVATETAEGYRFDVVLQGSLGREETVFLTYPRHRP